MKKLAFYILLLVTLLTTTIFSCKKFVDVKPPSTKVSGENAYQADNTAAAVMTGLYTTIVQTSGFQVGILSFSRFGGLSADELDLRNGTSDRQLYYYRNALYAPVPPAEGGGGYEFWRFLYSNVFTCNSVIEGVGSSNSLSPGVSKQLLGEAKFMRAFVYFYLVNMYGDVPLVLSTDYEVNRSLSRSPKAEVYKLIISDLKQAQDLLSTNYLNADLLTSTTERVRPTKAAATALLSRVYLYLEDWSNAEIQATNILNDLASYDIVPLNEVFKANSKEAIWQLQPVIASRNTRDGELFILTPSGPTFNNPVYLSSFLLNSFEVGDQRNVLGNWVNSVTVDTTTYYYPFKYKLGVNSTPGLEYQMMFRLGEQYLIRAEARAQLNKIAGAQSDLNVIRNRAGLGNTIATDQSSLLDAILHERQVELFTEMGQRWLDLKRTNMVDAVMSIVTSAKGGVWKSYQKLYPLPYTDIQLDNKLLQNQGY